jgi:hypothetical protein
MQSPILLPTVVSPGHESNAYIHINNPARQQWVLCSCEMTGDIYNPIRILFLKI